MTSQPTTRNLPSWVPLWMWSDQLECVVKIIGAGHFPDTVQVQLPNDIITEVYGSTLRRINNHDPAN